MTGKRIYIIVGFGILVAGMLTAFWLMTLPAQHQASSHLADQRAEKERQRLAVIQQVALKQQRLEERQLAEAQRLSEQEQRRREAERKDDEDRRLADTVRALESERVRQAAIVQASLKHRENEELKVTSREAELKEAGRQRQFEEDRRVTDAVRQLEKERVRQAEVVQASIKQRLDADHRQLGAAIVPATMRDAGTMESSTKPARPKAATYRVASGNKAGRTRKCAKSCPDVSRRGRATGPRHARRQVPSATEGWAYLCPWRWLESVVAELVGPVHVAERTGPRRLS